jgi:predicted DNA-binding transcriptional regulator AlpA
MNSHIENFFTIIEARLPKQELVSSKDLINAGIVKHKTALSRWRDKGTGPAFIRISRGQVRYLRSAVIEWLRQCSQEEKAC